MSRKAIEAIYRSLPTVACKRLCQNYCGPIACARLERDRIKAVCSNLTVKPDGSCPLLTAGGACAQYGLRPLVCRLWGAVDTPRLRCPHDCVVTPRKLTEEEAGALVKKVLRLGGGLALLPDGASRQERAGPAGLAILPAGPPSAAPG